MQSSMDVFKPSMIFSSSACVRFFCVSAGSDLLPGTLITPHIHYNVVYAFSKKSLKIKIGQH